MRELMCDFETIVGDKTRVWAWGVNTLDCLNFNYGNNIDSFHGICFT